MSTAAPARLVRHRGGAPVYDYPVGLDAAPVSVLRLHPGPPDTRPHIHDFPVLVYLPARGTVYVVAAGEVVDPARLGDSTDGVGVYFDPAALDAAARSPWPAWRSHPLLFPFLHRHRGGLLQLHVSAARILFWGDVIAALEQELATRQAGYHQAALAHLTLLLVELARLADDVATDVRRDGGALTADVLAVIERRFGETLSLRDVASELGLTPGYLTTVMRRHTGRTVQQWILERRMAEARALLSETDLPVAQVAQRVGIVDPGYFTRVFGRFHGAPPRRWRLRTA